MKYPDQVTQMVTPRSGDVKMLTGNRYRLSSKVLLSHTQWSGKSVSQPLFKNTLLISREAMFGALRLRLSCKRSV